MKKLLSLLLSFSILFTTLAPSYAQALDAVRAQKTPYEQMKTGWGLDGNKEGQSDAFTAAMERASEQIYAEAGQMRLAAEGIKAEYKGWVGSEYNAKDLLAGCEKEVSKAFKESKGDLGQALVCHEGTCHDAVIYGRACARGVLDLVWDGKSKAPVSAYRWGMEKKGYTAALASLVSLVGASAADKDKTFRYFTGVLKKDGICEKADKTGTKDSDNRLPRESECEAALRGLDALVVLANIYPDLKGKTADAVYGFMKDKRRGDLGAGAVYQGALSLMGLDTDYSYGLLKRFLLEDSRPTYAGTALDKLGYLTLEGITSAVQEGKADTAGRYLNGYTARFNYLDEDLGRKWIGPGNTCATYETAVSEVRNAYQCPQGNLYEDLGMVLVRDLENSRSVKLVKEIWESSAQEKVLGRYPAPLLTGILVGDQGAWTYKYGGAPAQAALKGLLRVDFTDMNEGTQRRLKVMAAEAVAAHEAFKPVKTQADEMYEKRHNVSMVYRDDRVSRYEKRDQAKFERYKTQQWHRSVFGMLDLAVLVVLLPKMLTSLGIYGARGAFAFSKVTGLRKMGALSERALAGLRGMNAPVMGGKGVQQQAAKIAVSHPNVAAPMSAAERVVRVEQVASRAAGEIKLVNFDVSRLTVGLGEATVSSTNKLPQAAKVAEAAGVKLSGPAVALERVPVTHRVGQTVNALGQTVKGYLPVNPAAPLAKPSFGKVLWGNVLEWGGAAKYEAGQIFSGVGHAMRSRTAALALWMSVNMSPAASVLESTVRLANPVKTELVVMNAAGQGATVAASTARTASVMRAGMQLSTNAVKAASAAPKAGNLLSHVLFVPAVATPDMLRQFGRFYDFKQSQPGASFAERFLPQLVKEAAIDYQKQLGAYETQQRQLQMQSRAFLSSAEQNTPVSQMSPALASGVAANAASNSSASGYLYSGIPVQVLVQTYNNRKINRYARTVLERTQPLPTELRDILRSKASEQFKKQALVRLYNEFNVFDQTIKTLPDETQYAIASYKKAKDDSMLADVLYSLFQADIFAQSLAHLSNHIPLDQFAQELESIIASPDFSAESQVVYNNTPVLSPESNLFTGVVRSLQGVNKEAVLAASRMKGWVVKNASEGVEVGGGWTYYENDIPVYYRYADGHLSASPVVMLYQEPSSWYAIMLGALGLSTKSGFKVPKGMVLALDENGKFKYVRQPGHLEELKSSKAAEKVLQTIYTQGSYAVAVDTPHSTTDLLAMAKMLEQSPNVNFQITLNKANSFKPFVNMLGFTFGMNVEGTMVGPFKEAAKDVESLVGQSVAPNMFGGVGYVTPRAAGELVPHMQKWGMDKASFTVLFLSLATLVGSWIAGINGVTPTEAFSLPVLALPMVVLVLASSLMRSSAPLLLNHYKDPQMRTAANLQMSTFQQLSRVALAGVTAIFPLIKKGGNDFVVIPAATIIVLLTLGLFFNTSMGSNVLSSIKDLWRDPAYQTNWQKIKHISALFWNGVKTTTPALAKGLWLGAFAPFFDAWNGIKKKTSRSSSLSKAYTEDVYTPSEKEISAAHAGETPEQAEAKAKQEREKRYRAAYEKEFLTQQETKDSLLRVTLAYASYAASIMLLNQVAKTSFGEWGQTAVTVFAIASLAVRSKATKWVGSGKFTDDQLTGISFAGLALMPLALALLPYGGHWAWLAGVVLAGIGLNMSTAVPGQLDNTRLQNNVTATMQERKNQVLQDQSLSAQQKKEKIADLEDMEKTWAGWASKDYSKANANGIYGVYAAVFVSLLASGWLSAITPDWSAWAARLIFLYAGGAALVGAWKTKNMARSFLRALFKKKAAVTVTAEEIAAGSVSHQTFGVSEDAKKANVLLAELWKGKKESLSFLKSRLNPYGGATMTSEVKMREILKRMGEIHNRLVAVAEVVSPESVRPAFESLRSLAEDYQDMLSQSNFSESINRQFDKLVKALCAEGTLQNGVAAQPSYMEEGNFGVLSRHEDFMRAKDLIIEMEVLASNIRKGGSAVRQDTYSRFVRYHNRAKSLLQGYMVDNPSEAGLVGVEENKIRRICRGLKLAEDRRGTLHKNAGPTSPQDVQLLEDILQAY